MKPISKTNRKQFFAGFLNSFLNVLMLFLLLMVVQCKTKKDIDKAGVSSGNQHAIRQAGNDLWSEESASIVQAGTDLAPLSFRVFRLNSDKLKSVLTSCPLFDDFQKSGKKISLMIPTPDSGFGEFYIYETLVMDTALSNRYPELKTYGGIAKDNPALHVRFVNNNKGFQAFVFGDELEYYVQPAKNDSPQGPYLSFYKKDLPPGSKNPFEMQNGK